MADRKINRKEQEKPAIKSREKVEEKKPLDNRKNRMESLVRIYGFDVPGTKGHFVGF